MASLLDKAQKGTLNWRGTGHKATPFYAYNFDTGLFLHMSGTAPTDSSEYAWKGTREQFANLQAAQPHAKLYQLGRIKEIEI